LPLLWAIAGFYCHPPPVLPALRDKQDYHVAGQESFPGGLGSIVGIIG